MDRTKLLSKETQLHKTIYIQDKVRAYYIEMGGTKEECVVDWLVYKTNTHPIPDTAIFYKVVDGACNVPTDKIEEAEIFIQGFTKWDGCSNFSFPDDAMLHICNVDEMKDVGVIFDQVYEMAKEMLADKWL